MISNRFRTFFSSRSQNLPVRAQVVMNINEAGPSGPRADSINVPQENAETKQMAKEVLVEFCSSTMVHGIRYVTEPNRHWLERIWWIVAIVLSIVCCTIGILSIWSTWNTRPVTVTFDDKNTHIRTIPFPAVTLCTTQKIEAKLTKVKENEGFEQIFPGDVNRLEALSQICPLDYNRFRNEDPIPQNESIYDTIKGISPSRSSIIPISQWGYTMSEPQFEPIFTKEGICFTANSINSREIHTDEIAPELLTVLDNPSTTIWNVEDGYQFHAKKSEVYPRRVSGTSIQSSMMLGTLITVDSSLRLCARVTGFKLTLNMPDDVVTPYKSSIYMPSGQCTFISIKPKVTATFEGLRSYAPEVRGCYFRSERRLRFYKSYSQQKCELECLANFIKNECNCVPFFMPRDDRTKVCRFSGFGCYHSAHIKFTDELAVEHCQCLPDCTSITYDVESSSLPMSANFLQVSDENGSTSFGCVYISFKEQHFISIIRTATSTMSEFASNCGGLLGLFMGISVLSIVEMVYYFTLRLFFKLRRQARVQPVRDVWVRRNSIPIPDRTGVNQPNNDSISIEDLSVQSVE